MPKVASDSIKQAARRPSRRCRGSVGLGVDNLSQVKTQSQGGLFRLLEQAEIEEVVGKDCPIRNSADR